MGSSIDNPSAVAATLPKTLFGYEVVDYLGQGAGSEIYAVSDMRTRQLYALKHVTRTDAKSERFVTQLETEFEIGRAVAHPGLRRSVNLTINRTLLRKVTEAALVLELFDGLSLEARPTSSLDSTLDCFIQVAYALDALNAAGYVHCDLKPNNILRSVAGVVKVIDLGQACKIGTIKARVQGTPDYISPEQVKCAELTNRTDVFNLGATLYWSLTGQNVPTLFRLKRTDNSFLLDDQIPSPRAINPGVPETLSALVMECVRNSPAKRPDSMGAIARRLEVIQHHLRHSARRDPAGGANGNAFTPPAVTDPDRQSALGNCAFA